MSAEGQDHPDQRIRDLDTQLGEVSERSRALDQEWSNQAHNDLTRYTFHSKSVSIAEDKIAVLKAMQTTDSSFKAAEVAREISRQQDELSRATDSANRYRPGSF